MTRRISSSDSALALATVLVTGFVFLFRGRGYRTAIWGDDKLLAEHAVDRRIPFGRLHFIDPIGLLDPFAGYLVVILRVSAKVLTVGGIENFSVRAFWFASLSWIVIATVIALSIGRYSRPSLGFLAALTMAVMPFSNLVMLGQVNTIYIPAVLALIIVVVTRQYPKTRFLQAVTVVLFALVTLTTIIAIIAFGYLIWLVYFRAKTVRDIERRMIWVMGGSLVLQALSYQPRGRTITPSKFFHELFLSSNAFAPQFLREKILEPKSAFENVLLYGIPVLLGITVFVLVRLGRQTSRRAQVEVAQTFFLLGSLLICLLIAGNGWLNSHYLFVPTGLFWIGVILVSDAARLSASRLRFIPIVIVLVAFSIQLSGTYFVI